MTAPHVLSNSATRALSLLQAQTRGTPGELSRKLDLSLSEVSRALRELRAAGLIRETRYWSPTSAGKEISYD